MGRQRPNILTRDFMLTPHSSSPHPSHSHHLPHNNSKPNIFLSSPLSISSSSKPIFFFLFCFMGQAVSVPLTRLPSYSSRRCSISSSKSPPALMALPVSSPDVSVGGTAIDYTAELPDEVLGIMFQLLTSGDRKRCSLVCRRWFFVEGQSRQRLALDARLGLADSVGSIVMRFSSVSKLALKCERRSDSIGDETIAVIANGLPGLTRLKLRACRAVTDSGMESLAGCCVNLRKLSVGSCAFGSKGIESILKSCKNLEELSIKRLRGLSDVNTSPISADLIAGKLRAICLKELYNGQCFAPLIANSPNLKILKLFRCSGDWDPLLEEISIKVTGLTEIHLEKLQVSDRGLSALSLCPNLEVLHLVKTPECTDNGITSIAQKCNLLRKIHIDGWKTNRIGDSGLISIAKKCPNLQELVLIGVNPTSKSLELIASNCPNLERLALCGSETFGDPEISCIASKCKSLKKLCIKGCPISDLGMEALAEGCPKLVKVKVKKCRLVTAEFAEWLKSNRESLSVNFDAIDERAPPELSEIVENLGSENEIDLGENLGANFGGNLRTSSGRTNGWKVRMNLFVSVFKKWTSNRE
ncbi:hypothetical protein LUZ60_008771 [Juncus effusus]|nr:hypothetical protein LUZ60_008771 [Juncus effusus]